MTSLQLENLHHLDLIQLSVKKNKFELFITSTSQRQHQQPNRVPDVLIFDNTTVQRPKIDWLISSLASTTSKKGYYNTSNKAFLGLRDGSFYPVTMTGACAWIISILDGEE